MDERLLKLSGAEKQALAFFLLSGMAPDDFLKQAEIKEMFPEQAKKVLRDFFIKKAEVKEAVDWSGLIKKIRGLKGKQFVTELPGLTSGEQSAAMLSGGLTGGAVGATGAVAIGSATHPILGILSAPEMMGLGAVAGGVSAVGLAERLIASPRARRAYKESMNKALKEIVKEHKPELATMGVGSVGVLGLAGAAAMSGKGEKVKEAEVKEALNFAAMAREVSKAITGKGGLSGDLLERAMAQAKARAKIPPSLQTGTQRLERLRARMGIDVAAMESERARALARLMKHRRPELAIAGAGGVAGTAGLTSALRSEG